MSETSATRQPHSIRTILLIAWWPVGGIRTYIKYVYRYFPPDRYRFVLLAPASQELDILRGELASANFLVESCEQSASSLVSALLRVQRKVKIDLIHSHGLTSAGFAFLPAFLSRVPHVITLHDVFREQQFQGSVGVLKKAIARVTLTSAHAVHVVGEGAAKNTVDFFPALAAAGRNVTLIRNGIVSEGIRESQVRNVRAELDLDESHFLVGFLGRFMSQKGFRFLVDAIQSIVEAPNPGRSPIVVCTGSGGFVREDREHIRNRGLDAYFRFLPFTPDVGPLVKGLDVVAIPSLWEAGPLLPMEVLSAGVPLIGTSCIGLAEVLMGSPATVVAPRDSAGLANALRMHMARDVRPEFQAYASHAAQRFHIKTAARALEDLYTDVLSRKGEGVPKLGARL